MTLIPDRAYSNSLTVVSVGQGGKRSGQRLYPFRVRDILPRVSSSAYPTGTPAGGIGVAGEFRIKSNVRSRSTAGTVSPPVTYTFSVSSGATASAQR